MREKWQRVKLGDIAQIIMGQLPPGSTYNESGEGLPFFQGVADFGVKFPSPRVYCTAPTRFAESGDILLSVRAPIGRVNRCTQRCAIGRGLCAIRISDPIDQTFLEFVLRSMGHQWNALEGQGSIFGNARKDDLYRLMIVWPDKTVRYAIANILGALDDKIDCNRRINQTLEAMAQALYKHWFVDFRPFRDGEFVDSELGRIPTGWEVCKLDDIAENVRVSVDPHSIPPDTPYIGLEHMPRGCIALSEWSMAADVTSNKWMFRRKQILFGKLRPYFKKVGVAPIDGVCSSDILVIEPYHHTFFGLVLCQLIQDDFINFADMASGGTRMPRISWDQMSRYPMPVPPEGIIAEFNTQISSWIEVIIQNINENQNLAYTRDYLLPKLLSGEVEVKVAEKQMEELV